MKIKVTWIEEWARSAELTLTADDLDALASHAGHPEPFSRLEVEEWLEDTATDDSQSWLPLQGNLDPSRHDVEYVGATVEGVVSEDYEFAPDEVLLPVRRPVQSVDPL